jgi:hypothetical protein
MICEAPLEVLAIVVIPPILYLGGVLGFLKTTDNLPSNQSLLTEDRVPYIGVVLATIGFVIPYLNSLCNNGYI